MDLTKFKQESEELKNNLMAVAEYLNTINATIPRINEEVKRIKSAYSSDYIKKMDNLDVQLSVLKGLDNNANEIMKNVTDASLNDLEARMLAIEASNDKNNERLQKVENLILTNNQAIIELTAVIQRLCEKTGNNFGTKNEDDDYASYI